MSGGSLSYESCADQRYRDQADWQAGSQLRDTASDRKDRLAEKPILAWGALLTLGDVGGLQADWVSVDTWVNAGTANCLQFDGWRQQFLTVLQSHAL